MFPSQLTHIRSLHYMYKKNIKLFKPQIKLNLKHLLFLRSIFKKSYNYLSET